MKKRYTRIVIRAIDNGKYKRTIMDYAVIVDREDILTDLELYGGSLIKDNIGYELKVNKDMSIIYR